MKAKVEVFNRPHDIEAGLNKLKGEWKVVYAFQYNQQIIVVLEEVTVTKPKPKTKKAVEGIDLLDGESEVS